MAWQFSKEFPAAKRVKVFAVSAEALIDLFKWMQEPKRHFQLINNPIPWDAKVIGMERGNASSGQYNTMLVYVEAASFPPVPNGEPAPVVNFTFKENPLG